MIKSKSTLPQKSSHLKIKHMNKYMFIKYFKIIIYEHSHSQRIQIIPTLDKK